MSDTGLRAAGALALVLMAAIPAWATTNPDLPPKLTRGQVTYMTGGISREQQSAMKQAASRYSLELHFLVSGPAYVVPAYVPVTIEDRAGNVIFDASAYGPLMLAKLPDGRYTVSAQYAGKTETLDVRIRRGKRETLAFDWKP